MNLLTYSHINQSMKYKQGILFLYNKENVYEIKYIIQVLPTFANIFTTSLSLSACSAVVTCHPNQMSISLSKAVLLGVNREELGLMDSNCTATDNGTHFVLTTTLIGCGTSSRHTNKSVVYSNMVRLVLSPTAIITRAPNVKISFSCHYSKYGAVSTGAITNGREQDISETADQEFAHDGEFCWRNRCDNGDTRVHYEIT